MPRRPGAPALTSAQTQAINACRGGKKLIRFNGFDFAVSDDVEARRIGGVSHSYHHWSTIKSLVDRGIMRMVGNAKGIPEYQLTEKGEKL